MANLFDYLLWRGDLSFNQSPFNVVDSLILSVLSYVPFEGIVSAELTKSAIRLDQAAEAFFKQDIASLPIRSIEDVELLFAAAETKRFGSLGLGAYVSRINFQEEMQFAALTINTFDGAVFIAFRGTDQTLVGWKEDLNMTFLATVPSQRAAAAYLNTVANRVRGKLRIGGHSKGGNLSVYAASMADRSIQRRTLVVYNHDGPGLHAALIAQPGYGNIAPRIAAFIPRSSVVGLLLEHYGPFTVVDSSRIGLMQHDPFSWQILGPDFVRLESVADSSRFLGKTLQDWFTSLEPTDREHFVDALYEIVSASGARFLSDLTSDWLKTVKAASQSLKKFDKRTKKLLREVLVRLFEVAGKNLEAKRRQPSNTKEKSPAKE